MSDGEVSAIEKTSDWWVPFGIVAAHLAVGAFALVVLEGWSLVDSFYYAVVTGTLVGYGDLVPKLPRSRIFASIYAISSMVLIGSAAARLIEKCMVEGTRRLLQNDPEGVCKSRKRVVVTRGQVVSATLVVTAIAAVGVIVFRYNLGRTWVDIFYFLTACLSTVGWGDVHPATVVGKIFASIWLITIAGGFVALISRITDYRGAVRELRLFEEVASGKMESGTFEKIDADNDGKLSKVEFLAGSLIHMKKVCQGDIDEILNRFDELDKDSSQHIEKKELKLI